MSGALKGELGGLLSQGISRASAKRVVPKSAVLLQRQDAELRRSTDVDLPDIMREMILATQSDSGRIAISGAAKRSVELSLPEQRLRERQGKVPRILERKVAVLEAKVAALENKLEKAQESLRVLMRGRFDSTAANATSEELLTQSAKQQHDEARALSAAGRRSLTSRLPVEDWSEEQRAATPLRWVRGTGWEEGLKRGRAAGGCAYGRFGRPTRPRTGKHQTLRRRKRPHTHQRSPLRRHDRRAFDDGHSAG
jgi:hypothetical protein